MFESLIDGAFLLMRWDTFGIIGLGLFLGMFVGALPGFTTVMAMALVLPISFFMHPLVGIPFLIGVYKGGIYGGSIPAILIGVPGTGASIATTLDGPALAKKGKGKKALEIALFLPADILYRDGLVIESLDDRATFLAVHGIILTAIYLWGVLERRDRRLLSFGRDSAIVLVAYVVGILLLFGTGNR